MNSHHQFSVIEMGTNNKGEIEYLTDLARPTIALINNVAPSHLEGLKSVEQVADAKAEVFSGLGDSGVAVLNADDRFYTQWRQQLEKSIPGVKIVSFALDCDADVTADKFAINAQETEFDLSIDGETVSITLPLAGRHNLLNALAASAIGYCADVNIADIKAGLECVTAVKGRLEYQPGIKGATVIDDSYNANPNSIKAAIDVLKHTRGRKILVLGAMAELGDNSAKYHTQIGEYAKLNSVDHLFGLVPDENSHGCFYRDGYGNDAEVFTEISALIHRVEGLLDSSTTVLIKGSRSSKMERVVEQLIKTNQKNDEGAH